MRRKWYYKKKRAWKTGRGIPYIYKNSLFRKITQQGTGVIAKVLAHLLANVGDVTGL